MLYQLAAAFKRLLSPQMGSCENVKMSTLKVKGLSNDFQYLHGVENKMHR